jgi:hypothetical protein
LVIDTTSSRRAYRFYFGGGGSGIDYFLDNDPRISASYPEEPCDEENTPAPVNEPLDGDLYLICRGHVPAYLISSGVHATPFRIVSGMALDRSDRQAEGLTLPNPYQALQKNCTNHW